MFQYFAHFSVYNNIHHPSKMGVGADFHCFKYKIEPKWEDPVCANGGKWTVTFQRGKSDTCWLYTLCFDHIVSVNHLQLLVMIREQFDHGDEICGAVVNMRARQEKIALWTKNAAKESAQMPSSSTDEGVYSLLYDLIKFKHLRSSTTTEKNRIEELQAGNKIGVGVEGIA
ncbi:hypothetical protein Cgig2_019812 [Carnegiea gigantea]|uniref:eIF-4F 25 kDa subunit n=1 Tax=Carnegiea gigantea TaxID=171969 RepID=A0A9Q1JGU3_9CARY|nr:hypothetical protein Cgig2_019812 [Carnegiea gigantea]